LYRVLSTPGKSLSSVRWPPGQRRGSPNGESLQGNPGELKEGQRGIGEAFSFSVSIKERMLVLPKKKADFARVP